ncbi:hypothetical protein pb186bvf_013924 [Paramecium bursaria]
MKTADERNQINPNEDNVQTFVSTVSAQERRTQHHTWFVRTFGPMNKGSLRQSIIALICTAMGSGMLSFPHNAECSGLAVGLSFIIISALLSRFSMHMLMKCTFDADKTESLEEADSLIERSKINTYGELVTYAYGDKMKIVYEINMIFYIAGAIIGYQILFISFTWQVAEQLHINPDYKDDYRYIGGVAFLILNFPISLLRDVYSLRYFTHLQILVIFYILVCIFISFIQNSSSFDPSKIMWLREDNLICIPQTFASTFFGFICHQLIFPIRSELRSATFKRMSKIFNRAILFEAIIYGGLMVFGYFRWFELTKPIIIDSYDSIYFIVAKGSMSFILFFAVPINLNPLRFMILQKMQKEKSKPFYVGITLFIQISSAAIAMIYPQINSVFSLLGGFLGLNTVIGIPGVIYLKLQRRKLTNLQFYGVIFLLIGTSIIGYSGALLGQFSFAKP